jgi:hypothetical protein
MAPPPGPGAVVDAPAPRREGGVARPALQLVREAGRLRPGILGTLIISMVFGTLFVLAVLQAVLVQGQLELDRLDRDIRELTAEKAKREVDVATAESPDRIQAAAAANGLVSPPEVVFLARASLDPVTAQDSGLRLDLDPARPDVAAGASTASAVPPDEPSGP